MNKSTWLSQQVLWIVINLILFASFNKALSRLKQALRAWYMELRNYLLASDFIYSLSYASLFILNKSDILLFELVYVDDIVITGNDSAHVEKFIRMLSERFSLKDLNNLRYFLGIEASRLEKGLLVTQTKYITDLLANTNLLTANLVSTPKATNTTVQLTFWFAS